MQIENQHVIFFNDKQIRNEFIKSFDESFTYKEIGEIVGLSQDTARVIKKDIKRIPKREYIEVTCSMCGKKRITRKDNNSIICMRCVWDRKKKDIKKSDKLKKNCKTCGKEFIIIRRSWDDFKRECKSCIQSRVGKIESGLSRKRTVFAQYKATAKRKKIKFNLSFNDFIQIAKQDCFYCGSKPLNIALSPSGNGDFIYNGIDRIDNTKGYTLRNTAPACKICNYAKNTLTLEDFYIWIQKTYQNLSKKGKFDNVNS